MVLPKVAYVLLWFPEPSETFIFNEVARLWDMGVSVKVYSLYGMRTRDLSPSMQGASGRVISLGIPYAAKAPADLAYWWKRDPRTVKRLFKTIPMRRWCDLETGGENLWGFLCGFRLARLLEEAKIEHIHAPWASGPTTAAWVASWLTGVPFSFAGRATDIYPADGALEEKISASAFVRTGNMANVEYLTPFAAGQTHKIHLIYSGHLAQQASPARVAMAPPYQILTLGRFVAKKGLDVLIRSCRILKDRGIDFRLTLGGSGPCDRQLRSLTRQLGLDASVTFTGFVRYDRVSEFLSRGDVFVMPCVVDPTGDRDGIPNVILEALLHTLPVVATDVCGIREIIRDGETGLLVPQRDPLALADAIGRMIGDREPALEMAERGRLRVMEEFNLDRNCHRIVGLFKEHALKAPLGR